MIAKQDGYKVEVKKNGLSIVVGVFQDEEEVRLVAVYLCIFVCLYVSMYLSMYKSVVRMCICVYPGRARIRPVSNKATWEESDFELQL